MSTCKMDATASAARSSSGPCFARNLARSGMALAYAGHWCASTFLAGCRLQAFGRAGARDSGEVICHPDVGPGGGLEQRLDGGPAVLAAFGDKNTARPSTPRCLRDEPGREF